MDWLALHRSPTFQETLQTQVVSDSYHDFKKVFRDIYTTYPDVGTPYIKPVRIASDGWDLIGKMTGIHSLASDPVGTQYSVRFPVHESLQSPLYKISVLDEKDVVGVANALCGTSTHANVLLDALTGHWWANTLKAKGPFSGKTYRVLTNRETVSDPAPKIPPNDDCYLKGVGKVVGLESYQDETPHAITYPAFSSPKFDPRRNFFSRYDLELSPVGYQYNCEEVILTFRGASELSLIHI